MMGDIELLVHDYCNAKCITITSITASIVISKNCTISFIDKENITVNKPNRLIAHPYSLQIRMYMKITVIY